MGKEDDLRETLSDVVGKLAAVESNPRAWLAWVVDLLARLEQEATNENASHREAFTDMLAALQDEIRTRQQTGGWH